MLTEASRSLIARGAVEGPAFRSLSVRPNSARPLGAPSLARLCSCAKGGKQCANTRRFEKETASQLVKASALRALRIRAQFNSLRWHSSLDALCIRVQFDSLRKHSALDALCIRAQFNSLRWHSSLDALCIRVQFNSLRKHSSLDALCIRVRLQSRRKPPRK
jgi:hypothetical protein